MRSLTRKPLQLPKTRKERRKMSQLEWIHAIIGGIASIIFLFQTLGSAEQGVDAGDIGGDYEMGDDVGGLSDYLSVRNFVAFFIGYGWVTLAGLLSGASFWVASLLGVAAGGAFVVASLFIIKTFLKFQEDGSLKVEKLIGEGASVYITIGESGTAQGKVLVDTKKGRTELPARTKDSEKLKPGEWVKIVGTEDGVLWVSKKEGDL